ncbi:hypothetical protein [Streptomyces xanthophaeus]|uniref:Secreted protein n=1 Tax=Streptomyces xanthophaeus TaxID=67385 RepID=A0A919L9J2_9ACTN|nr:hypothetical protein [Streptomyces xanthophaeus]WCD84338.1 hypothetical protein KPP03845_100660 [Streptomyces xanthophaeus]WST20597.1 hypothetical protein OG264_03225 [Streptomyces xanthophaeus]WST64416.1 hypothetical protein OG605_35135 [Streptomyces xanthophaeus]GHI83298.1 hypothetical protein Sxan_06620 [Streptomyces xanthophaeus]
MSNNVLIAVIVVAAVVVIALSALMWALARRRHLRERFGPEYDRTVEEQGDKRSAERDLRAREQRHDRLEIKELPPERRHQYADAWTGVQQQFVDRPERSVAEADELVTRLMGERGYPTEGYRDQVRDLSVEHGRTLEEYRAAHAVKVRSSAGEATTEELRGAMVHYRTLFEELLSDQRSR